ncbi:DUF1963 domain-containing protein [Eubacteriales bacterium OttesenSCG-928-M02]|nr:DUF1963 domain-containing protein [Eubacteriales bacterium OttesenSCG-928-M02]
MDVWQSIIVTTVTGLVISALFTNARKKGQTGTQEMFRLRFSGGVLAVGIICMLLFGAFLVFAIGASDTVKEDERVLVYGGISFFFLLGAVLTLAAARWQLRVDLGRIEYTPVIGRTRIIKSPDIAYVVVGTSMKAYDSNHRKLFSVDPTCKGKDSLISWLKRYGVQFGRDASTAEVLSLRLRGLFKRREHVFLSNEQKKRQEQWRERQRLYMESPPNLPENMDELLQPVLRQSIGLVAGDASVHCVIGRSKFGGEPDLPYDFKWNYFEGSGGDIDANGSYKEVVKSRPLMFLLQINCQEVKALYPQSPLPKKGLLSFFYEMESMLWGPERMDRIGYVKVHYFDADQRLVRTRLPLDLDPKYHIEQRPIILHKESSLPPFNEFAVGRNYTHNFANRKLYDQYRAGMGVEHSGHGELAMDSRLFGWPESIQNSVFDEIENEYLKDISSSDAPYQERTMTDSQSEEWELLLQLDSGTFDEMGAHSVMFGDYGNLYFVIRKEDLAAGRFDRVWFTLQCT